MTDNYIPDFYITGVMTVRNLSDSDVSTLTDMMNASKYPKAWAMEDKGDGIHSITVQNKEWVQWREFDDELKNIVQYLFDEYKLASGVVIRETDDEEFKEEQFTITSEGVTAQWVRPDEGYEVVIVRQ